jgi:hypothetical protein
MLNWHERRKANREIAVNAVIDDRAARRKQKDRNVVVGFVAIFLILAFLYLFVVTPTFVTKPVVAKPALATASDIDSAHVNWLLNEVGAYRLHTYLMFGETPVIESVITDQGKVFTTTVRDNQPTTVVGTATNPDIRFSMSGANFMTLYAASDTLAQAQAMRRSGQIVVNILKDDFTMAVKGYNAIYDSLPP